MAKGWKSIHPLMASGLQKCGIEEWQVTQGYGNAPASAGFHAVEGYKDGHPFSSCVDLTWQLTKRGAELKSHLVEAGFCPFYRDWDGNQHIHCVYVGARDGDGRISILPGPRTQIIDYTRGLDGLVGHNPLTGQFAPTQDERQQILKQYTNWAPHVATTVKSFTGAVIRCYAFEEMGVVRCEVRTLVEALGGKVSWDGSLEVSFGGVEIDLHLANIKLEGGQFNRGNIRAIVEGMGFGIEFASLNGSSEIRVVKKS